ncbi:hypothetical protein DPMN_079084 [Dreissena polymorpha]|uniref:Mab-21-like HhH/H2TH-like domain-containing protein n=1 Tax=Dreissena polymorpha TaxID=45954 RepID=A0A9D4BPQ7_DREPO|nr:hypothetical protein DPMN_079084 [Dreissena polymorpha]
MMNKENKPIVTSTALAKALNDIGVNNETIQFRRKTWLYIEALHTISCKAKGGCSEIYNFGSQTEGTTTEGMHSDFDVLQCDTSWPVITDFADWQSGRRWHSFVVMDMSTPPQCCCLQTVSPHYPEFLLTEDPLRGHYKGAQGRQFLKSTMFHMHFKGMCNESGVDFVPHGPALTIDKLKQSRGPSLAISEETDFVRAFHCAKLPEDCQYLFRRPKPGHWPRQDLLTQLKDSGVFVVPTAPVENTTHWDPLKHLATLTVRTHDNSHELYWRLSTNLIERHLMFDLTMTQIKVYVIMKMIRKEFCKPLVGDRLSTFHLKTALLYCVEASPLWIWEDVNLIQCLQICLQTVRRWLKARYCPHYTTANVNLFAGKLQFNEFPILIELFTDMIRNDVFCLHNVKMDDLGYRISQHSTDSTHELPCEKLDIVVAEKTFKYLIDFSCVYLHLLGIFRSVDTSQVMSDHIKFIQILEKIQTTSSEKNRSIVSIVLPFHYSIQAAMKASLCIGQNQSLPQEIFTLCDKSLTSDVTSSRLKLASLYFVLRRYEETDAILTQVDALISNKVIPLSPFWGFKYKFDSELLGRQKEFIDILQNSIALSTIFSRHEMNCVPEQLVAEFYRTVTVEDENCRNLVVGRSFWMDLAVVDSKTYMYYLQYLTFRFTGLISDKDIVFQNFQDHVFSDKDMYVPNTFAHVETSLNLLGHCWELEGILSLAWRCYRLSLSVQPRNNAAYWHIFKMIGRLIFGL